MASTTATPKPTGTYAAIAQMGIGRIVIVDDDYDADQQVGITADAVIRRLDEVHEDAGLANRIQQLQPHRYGLDLVEVGGGFVAEQAYVASLTANWRDAPDNIRKGIAGMLGIEDTTPQTYRTIADFESKVGEAIEVEHLSVEDWSGRRARLFEAKGQGPLTVVLFDMDLKNADLSPWGIGDSRTAGATLAQEAVDDGGPLLIAGIVTGDTGLTRDERVGSETRSVPDADKELRATKELSQAQDGYRGTPVGVLSKLRLDSPQELARGIKLLVAMSAMVEARDVTFQACRDALTATFCHVGAVSEFDLDLDVMLHIADSAEHEGVHVSEYLERMLGEASAWRAHVDVRRGCARSAKLTMLRRLCEAVQGEAEHPLLGLFGITEGSLAEPLRHELRHRDVYRDGRELNRTRHPIAIGDVFRIRLPVKDGTRPDDRFFVMLQQPCSIAVRLNGKRHAGAEHFTLVGLLPGSDHDRGRTHTLPAPEPPAGAGEGAGAYHVDFALRRTVPAPLLDLCVFGGDGRSTFVVLDSPELAHGAPEELLETGWHLYHEQVMGQLHDRCASCERLLENLGDTDDDTLRKAVVAGKFGLASDLWDVAYDARERRFDFGIRRVGRLAEPYATGILSDFAHYHSRAAYPGNLVGGA